MIDLHAHVLPGIDDGPPDLDGTLALLAAAARDRTRVIAATPHLRADFPDVRVEKITHMCADVQAHVPSEWQLRIVPAAEADATWTLSATDEQLRLASYGQRGTDLLVETPYGVLPPTFDGALDRLAAKGLRVVLAHPELNQDLQRAPERAEELVARGVLLQISAGSLVRASANSPRGRLARRLLERGRAHVIASDAHSAGPVRQPGLSSAVAAARDIAPQLAGWMVTAAPAAILAGRPLPPPPAGPARDRSRWRIRPRS